MDITLKNLNTKQQEAVTHTDGPLLIVAGAGTGKTTVITQRIAWLIEQQQLSTDNILALTFTDKAAGEMEERIDKLLPYGYVDLWISTFHSFCERILKAHALDIGLPHDFKLLTQTESWLLVKKNLDKFELDYYRPMGNPTKFIHALLQHFSRCKDEEVYPEDYLAYAEALQLSGDAIESSGGKAPKKREPGTVDEAEQEAARLTEVANAYHVYQQLLLEHNSLDFGDLINYTLKLFKQRPKILKHYQEQFKYVLVDEFQDTNWAQYELIKLLAAPTNNITVVGDDDQSIFKFRGASVSNILHFKKEYQDAKEIVLQTNYRSPQQVLDMAYAFIQQNNPDRLEVKLSTGKNKLSKELTSADNKQGMVDYIFAESLADEVKEVVDTIIELKAANKDITWQDFLILVRANDSAKEFVHELTSRGIPHQFLAARGLYLKPVIRDIVNYLRLLDNYRESPALYRILSMPVLDISQYQIANLMYWAGRKSWSVFEVLKQIQTISNVHDTTLAEVQKLVGWIDKHTQLVKTKSVWHVVLAFLEDSGYLKYIESLEPNKMNETFNELNQFAKKIKEFEQSFDSISVSDFLDEFELELESGDTGSLQWDIETGPDMVRIMTMHAAKGLEFEYVFVPNLVDKRFPTINRRDPIELPEELIKDMLPEGNSHIQEERRLMYVAMTRARKGLFFSGAADYGGARKKKPSQFLYELGFVSDKPQQTKKAKQTQSDQFALSKEPASKAQTTEYKLPAKYSFTQLKAYQSCPLQYKYAHILRIPVRGKHTFSFGKSIHGTLHAFFDLIKQQAESKQGDLFAAADQKQTKKVTASEKDLLQLYEEHWIDDWYDSKQQHDEYKQKGKQALKAMYKEWIETKQVPVHLEKGFNLRVADYTIKGVMDRVDQLPDGGLEIIDYKTGQSKDEKKVDKTQLLIYQLAAKQVFTDEVKYLTFYYVEDGKRVQFLGKDSELEKVKKEIVETIEKIATGDFTPTPSPHTCKFCDFNHICDFSQA